MFNKQKRIKGRIFKFLWRYWVFWKFTSVNWKFSQLLLSPVRANFCKIWQFLPIFFFNNNERELRQNKIEGHRELYMYLMRHKNRFNRRLFSTIGFLQTLINGVRENKRRWGDISGQVSARVSSVKDFPHFTVWDLLRWDSGQVKRNGPDLQIVKILMQRMSGCEFDILFALHSLLENFLFVENIKKEEEKKYLWFKKHSMLERSVWTR